MSRESQRNREILELVIAANSGEASDEQIARLDEIVRTDRNGANLVARILEQQAALVWQGTLQAERPGGSACRSIAATVGAEVNTRESRPDRFVLAKRYAWLWPAVAVGIGFVLGSLTVAAAYRAITAPLEKPVAATAPNYEAKLIRSTACLWDGAAIGNPQIGSGLTSGESLHLLEGLAEFKLNWLGGGKATLSLEGPAGMMLTSEGMPTLRFGRLSGTIRSNGRPFTIETSVGRLTLADHGSIGVSAYGNEGEIHIFDGVATLEPAWRSPEQTRPLTIEAGSSIRIQTDENGESESSWHSADPAYFAAQVSMSSDGLAISPAYAEAVKKSKPLGYWRFERSDWPNVPNAMGPDFACHVSGEPGRISYQGNQAIEFGVSHRGSEIVSDAQVGDAIRDSYSVEFWVKPSHYHLGSVVSLVGDTPMANGPLPHGMLIELGGSGKIPTASHHPGCIRFLHRYPAGKASGTSCYSKNSYTLRKWQHVVATKDGEKMRLYINGELAAQGTDKSPVPPGMRLLVGSLYPTGGDRPFNGQLDELALYDRALGESEITQHYQLVRPALADPSSI